MAEHLKLVRELDAPPEEVWRAFTSAVALADWFWPFPTTASVEARPGGRFRLSSPALTVEGEVTEADPPWLLALTWQWEGEVERTSVRLELAPAGGGTELRVTHSGFADAATRDDHIQGWNDCLDRLSSWLAAQAG